MKTKNKKIFKEKLVVAIVPVQVIPCTHMKGDIYKLCENIGKNTLK